MNLKKRYTLRQPVLTLVGLLIVSGTVNSGNWRALKGDGLHDPENPSLEVLQDPGDALNRLPPDSAGNKVNWAKALSNGYIKPRSGLTGDKSAKILDPKSLSEEQQILVPDEASIKILDLDIIMSDTGTIPMVRFSHKIHTQWLDCASCHEKLFKLKAGTSLVNMGRILEGKDCGVCHGAVAFPLTECSRCHSVPKKTQTSTAVQPDRR